MTERARNYTVAEVSKLLKLSRACVSRWCQNGKVAAIYSEIPGTSVGCYLIPESSVEYLRRNVTPRKNGGES